MAIIYFPTVKFCGLRFRARVRATRQVTIHMDKQTYPEGVAYRFWLLNLLLAVMVDDDKQTIP